MNWKLKEPIKQLGNSYDFWNDLAVDSYIEPSKILSNKSQIKKLNEAIELIKSFEKCLFKNYILS